MDTLDRITSELKSQGKSQKELMLYLGVHPNLYTNWKGGRNTSYHSYLPQIAEFLGVSIDYLAGRVSDPQMYIIPADPEKVREHEEFLEKRREESQRKLYEAMRNYCDGEEQIKKSSCPERQEVGWNELQLRFVKVLASLPEQEQQELLHLAEYKAARHEQ